MVQGLFIQHKVLGSALNIGENEEETKRKPSQAEDGTLSIGNYSDDWSLEITGKKNEHFQTLLSLLSDNGKEKKQCQEDQK